jgi:hypothetical protein
MPTIIAPFYPYLAYLVSIPSGMMIPNALGLLGLEEPTFVSKLKGAMIPWNFHIDAAGFYLFLPCSGLG